MRPDFVSEKTTPTLWKLAREGVTFRNHHAVYPSATQVNGTALVTGVYPGRSGVIANYAYRPEIDRTRSISVESPKSDSFAGELPKRGSCFLADKVRAHSVPHHHDDMPVGSG